jgi:hypothetical protein
LSATEIEVFDLCRRKWAYQYLDGIRPLPSKAAQFGVSVHEVLQKYLTGYSINYQTPEGRVASPGLSYLPKRINRENVERPIFFLKNGRMFHGFIDFFEQVGSQTWLIGDHKTCSDFKRVLSSDQLKKNVQANIYAQWAFVEKNAKIVKLRWIYYRTKLSPKSICVETDLTKDEADENFSLIAKTADDIFEIVKNKPLSSTQPKNTSSCFKYGRCHFYSQCKGSVDATATSKPKLKEYDVTSSKSFHLFIDCVPTKNESPYERTVELSELLKPVLSKIQTEKELSHYRLAGYGQHVGLIANYLSEHLSNNAYDNRTAILSSLKTPEGCDTLQTLTAAAGRVVRGF